MSFQAIIFDLFGTLVDNFTKIAYDEIYRQMVARLGAPYDEFRDTFGHSFSDRCRGRYDSIEENIEASCRQIGVFPTTDQIQSAARHRYDFTLKTLEAKEEVLSTLRQLRKDDFQIGLITDWGPDVPLLWGSTTLSQQIEVPVFSCEKNSKNQMKRYTAEPSKGWEEDRMNASTWETEAVRSSQELRRWEFYQF